jgi:hypothetical protein
MVRAVSRRHWSCRGSGRQSPALAVPWLKRSVAGIGRTIPQAISRRHWPCHDSGDQSLALAVPWLRRSVAFNGRAMTQAVSRRYWPCHGSGGWSPATSHGGPESIQGRSMWGSWWTEWHWDWVLTEYFGISLSVQCTYFDQCSGFPLTASYI